MCRIQTVRNETSRSGWARVGGLTMGAGKIFSWRGNSGFFEGVKSGEISFYPT